MHSYIFDFRIENKSVHLKNSSEYNSGEKNIYYFLFFHVGCIFTRALFRIFTKFIAKSNFPPLDMI